MSNFFISKGNGYFPDSILCFKSSSRYFVGLPIQYVLLITRPAIIEYAYNEGNLWVPNAPVLYITNKKPVIRETGFRRICI